MISSKKFWAEECNSPVLRNNNGYLKYDSENKETLDRTAKWLDLLNQPIEQYKIKNENLEEDQKQRLDTIIEHDTYRTFCGEIQKKDFKELLTAACYNFHSYHAGLSFVASFLILHFDTNTAFGILSELNYNKKYIPGYWAEPPVNFATDAYVFDNLLEKYLPEVHKHLESKFLFPQTFCQPWFVGLNVPCLSFEPLYRFFEKFLEKGYTFLFQFGLALVDTLKEQILSSEHLKIFKILRLEESEVNSYQIGTQIVERAISNPFDFSDLNFEELRKNVYEEKLKPRLEINNDHRNEDDEDLMFDSDSDSDLAP